MPNSIGPLGLTTATQAELLAQFTTSYQTLYGSTINIASNTPDGQNINNFIQATLDVEDLITQVNAMFDPDQAVGVILDQRCAINGVIRQPGTFTVTNISVITGQSVNLFGLDQTTMPVYTVSDNAGNLWELITTQLAVPIGTNVYAFQAATPGANLTTPNTITVQVTIVLGVASVNNPSTYTTLGTNEESDAKLKLRRQKSVSLASQGYLAGLLAALLNITGVTDAFVYENIGDAPDSDGVPGHSIWVIVSGTGAAADIANAIYTKRNAGCGMFGEQMYVITQVNGVPFTVLWDDVVSENLYIKFNATSIDGVTPPDTTSILAELPVIYVPGVNAEVNINQLATLVQQIDPNTLVTGAGFSTTSGGTFTKTLSPTAKNYQFVVLSANISVTIV